MRVRGVILAPQRQGRSDGSSQSTGTGGMPTMSNVFVSYSRRSEVVARRVVADLERLGRSVWFDNQLTGGQAWWDQILESIRACDVFVLILDPGSLQSEACTREFGYAASLGKPILPLLVADGVSTNLLPAALTEIHFVDYREEDQEAAFHLARAFAGIPAAPTLPDPLPEPPEVPISYLGGLAAQVDQPALTLEEQRLLVMDLKDALQDPGTATDARQLLRKLRERRDLFARVAKEIDRLGDRGNNFGRTGYLVAIAATIALGFFVFWEPLSGLLRPAPAITTAIELFESDRSSVTAGDSLTLSWRTSGADTVELQPEGRVKADGTMSLNPQEDTEYVLIAAGPAGEARKTIKVSVTPATRQDSNDPSQEVALMLREAMQYAAEKDFASARDALAKLNSVRGLSTADREYIDKVMLDIKRREEAVTVASSLRPLVTVAPVYPARAKSRGQEGYVNLQFTVTAAGTVQDPVVDYSTSSLFERPAVAAVLKYKYRPRVVDGTAVDTAGVTTRVDFKISD